MSENQKYLRIGRAFYKQIRKPLASGDHLECLVYWNKDFIRDDYGREFLGNIQKYDGFCCVPDHVNFKEVISGFYNTYKPLSYSPTKGQISNSMLFARHIFGEQLEVGLDYLKILFERPTQILPVLCLVSKQRNTGKTTFLNWMKAIFGSNMTYNTNDDFRSQFNADWSSKLIIAVDEVLLDKRDDTERIKNLSTARSYKIEAKGKDKSEIEFFGKFILCSNNENNFIRIDPGEIRFWVRKIVPFEIEDEGFLEKLQKEIPAFTHFLINRNYSTENKTRMWFTPGQLKTQALKRLFNFNRNIVEVELANTIIEIIENNDLEEFKFCLKDIQNLLLKTPYKESKTKLKRLIKEDWKLSPKTNSLNYVTYRHLSDGTLISINDKGRYYTVTKKFLQDNYGEMML